MDEELLASVEAAMSNPELRRVLLKIVKYEEALRKKYPDKPSWWEWEIGDVGVEPWLVVKLQRMGLVERTYASSNHKYYRLVDFEAIRKILDKYGQSITVSKKTGGKKTGLDLSPPRTLKEIPKDLFDVIVGHEELKWVFMKSLHKERYHILLVGPPATAKTLFLLAISQLPGAVFVDVPHATRVGIRDLIIQFRPRYLLLDEFDKANNEDFWHGLANIMETGKVVVTKHGTHFEMETNVNIYATANSDYNIPSHVMSRFDVYYLEPYDEETLYRIIVHLLVKMYSKPEKLARRIADVVIHELGSRDIRDAIKVAKIVDSEKDLENYLRAKKKYSKRRKARRSLGF